MISCDVLVVGGGGAGLRAAIAAAQKGADVLVASKTRVGHTNNTYLSKGVIASSGWTDRGDSPQIHLEDTLKGGRYLNDRDRVEQFTSAVHEQTALLQKWGVPFGKDAAGRVDTFRIPGHSFARHIYCSTWKGSDLILPVKHKAKASGVRFIEKVFVTTLLVSDGGVCGAIAMTRENRMLVIKAGTIILATGGFGQVFLNTNNAPGITGDGHALAYHAGAQLQDMEFVQFYPTTLGRYGSRILLYEQLLVQPGVVLKNSLGEDILKKNGVTAPMEVTRDELSQLIMTEILREDGQETAIFMDLEKLDEDMAAAFSTLLPAGWEKGQRKFQVVPTTHFCMGGIVVDKKGETGCPGLFAAGETTAGAHGANRLGGNALAEVFTLGALAGEAAAQKAKELSRENLPDPAIRDEVNRLLSLQKTVGEPVKTLTRKLKEIMWCKAGIIRDDTSLKQALETVRELAKTPVSIRGSRRVFDVPELGNMLLAAEMVCRAALRRQESRGAHCRTDFPKEDDENWKTHIRIQKKGTRMSLV